MEHNRHNASITGSTHSISKLHLLPRPLSCLAQSCHETSLLCNVCTAWYSTTRLAFGTSCFSLLPFPRRIVLFSIGGILSWSSQQRCDVLHFSSSWGTTLLQLYFGLKKLQLFFSDKLQRDAAMPAGICGLKELHNSYIRGWSRDDFLHMSAFHCSRHDFAGHHFLKPRWNKKKKITVAIRAQLFKNCRFVPDNKKELYLHSTFQKEKQLSF